VKIGYSTRPHLRVAQLSTGSSQRLRLLGWIQGSLKTERAIHALFAADRDNGEWFRDSERLRKYLDDIELARIETAPKTKPERKKTEARWWEQPTQPGFTWAATLQVKPGVLKICEYDREGKYLWHFVPGQLE